MKSEEGGGDPGLDRQHQRLQPVRQVAAEGRDQRAEQREDQHPEEHRALVVPPDAGDLVEERLRRMRVLDDVEQREVGDDVGVDQRREGDADEQELRHRRRARRRPSAARRRASAPDRTGIDRLRRAPAPARGRGRNGRARRSWPPLHRGAARRRRRPSCQRPAPSARRPPRAACSSRRAWRAPCRR